MIEAVNSVIANASLIRGNVEQVSSSRSFAANPNKVQEAAPSTQGLNPGPQAPFISPFVVVDVNFDKAVLQFRDSDTGDVLEQIPSRSRLEALQRVAARQTQQTSSSSEQASSAPQASSRSSQIQAQQLAQATTTARSSGSESVSSVSNSTVSSSQVAQAQIASQALSTGAQTTGSSSSASAGGSGTTVFA